MSQPQLTFLPEPPAGILYLRSIDDVLKRRELDAYQHLLTRAWKKLKLSGVLVIRGIPTVYLREDDAELSISTTRELQKLFWNQGVATLLVLVDRLKTRVFSGMVPPSESATGAQASNAPLDSFVTELNIAGQALRAHRDQAHEGAIETYKTFCRQVVSGHFYRLHSPSTKEAPRKFDPRQMVDAYLLDQLAAVRDELTRGKRKLPLEVAHAFLGRLLFTCYLVDRGIVKLDDPKYFPKEQWTSVQQVLEGEDAAVFDRLYKHLFPQLKRDFNGSMFDDAGLDEERAAIHAEHLRAVRFFFGAHDVAKNQRNLPIWRYDFGFIPVETISAIYENFLAKEGDNQKREDGAFYTPRFLAEMTIDLATEESPQLTGRQFLDPSCGSGIFLVLLFNRLAAEWTAKYPQKATSTSNSAFSSKDQALREALASLRGVDKNLTACRIACFSLYLAFLDQFEPSDIRAYIQKSENNKLPNLLRHAGGKGRKPDIPVIWEGDFFPLATIWSKDAATRFDYVVGNPPWAGRGEKQIAQDFMEQLPTVFNVNGKAALLLPTKVFFNKTDSFQSQWLRRVTLETVVQLSDYRFLLFTNAICPCLIARFSGKTPDVENHQIRYLTPKVARVDLRQGAIPISPQDQKSISLRVLLAACAQKAATIVWKSRFWGTPRDVKFLDHLFALPRLSGIAGRPNQVANGLKRWTKAQGFQPLRIGQTPNGEPKPLKTKTSDSWSLKDLYVDAKAIKELASFPAELCGTLDEFLEAGDCLKDKLRRKPPNQVFTPPLVLLNQGFTGATFFDFPVRFQDSLQSIAGPTEDADYLIFLAACLRSRLSRYFAFHTSANIGMERDKVHLDEVLGLPFGLPDTDAFATPRRVEIVQKIAAKFRKLQTAMGESARDASQWVSEPKLPGLNDGIKDASSADKKKWAEGWRKKTAKAQSEIEPLIFEYYGLIGQEQALVEDTCAIFDKSATPGALDTLMPTLASVDAEGLLDYAQTLEETLKGWSINNSLSTKLTAGVNKTLGLAILKIESTKRKGGFHVAPLTDELAGALKRIEEAATTTNGTLIYLHDETWWFDGPTITLSKPALYGRWTRTAALNDAAEVYATIQQSRSFNP
jgi:hypothetical protein